MQSKTPESKKLEWPEDVIVVLDYIERDIKRMDGLATLGTFMNAALIFMLILIYVAVAKDQPGTTGNEDQSQCIEDATSEGLFPRSANEAFYDLTRPVSLVLFPVDVIGGFSRTEYHHSKGKADRTPLIQSGHLNGPRKNEHQHTKHKSELVPLIHDDLTNEIQHGITPVSIGTASINLEQ